MERPSNDTEAKPSRRNVALALFGALGGAALLNGCGPEDGEEKNAVTPDAPEPLQSSSSALTGTGFKWLTAIGTAAAPLDLRNLSTTGLVADQVVAVTGFATHGDGGGGLFYWDSASTATDDGGTIIRPASTPPPVAGSECSTEPAIST